LQDVALFFGLFGQDGLAQSKCGNLPENSQTKGKKNSTAWTFFIDIHGSPAFL
jgi:hypothetical protein